MSNKNACLVTGCAGFIGRHLAKRLLDDGYRVIGVDNFVTGSHDPQDPRLEFIEADISDLSYKLPDETLDFVFHTAAIPRIPVSFERPVEILTNNFNSTLWALELCRRTQAKMIFSSSSSIYGNQDTYPVREDMEPHPGSPYAVSKLISEKLCENYQEAFGVSFVALRYFNVIGTGMTTKNGYATVLPIWLEQKQRGEALTITGDGSQLRDFTSVDDTVEANILAMTKGQGVYNIGANNPRSVLEVAKMISDDLVFIESRREAKNTHADHAKAKAELGWQPTQTLEDVMKEIL
ncbi:NAD-dependent epimerase/dehydratase family protein [Patescibacteria group bacterium]|nr:NAD-dependent epimerase/dehydratase family protein [Patescibacteria group bacterium]